MSPKNKKTYLNAYKSNLGSSLGLLGPSDSQSNFNRSKVENNIVNKPNKSNKNSKSNISTSRNRPISQSKVLFPNDEDNINNSYNYNNNYKNNSPYKSNKSNIYHPKSKSIIHLLQKTRFLPKNCAKMTELVDEFCLSR